VNQGQRATPVRLDVEITTRCTKQEGFDENFFGSELRSKTLPERLMKRSLATPAALGISHARTQPMKNLNSDLHPEHEALGNATTRAAKRSQEIRIVFEDDVNARGVKIPIRTIHASAKISMPEFKNHNKLAYPHPRPRHAS
jgi:hypothetical protein